MYHNKFHAKNEFNMVTEKRISESCFQSLQTGRHHSNRSRIRLITKEILVLSVLHNHKKLSAKLNIV